jgi:hypothetical protein
VEVVLLKSVLHDWNDGDAVRILRRAREALAPEGRLLVIERVMPDRVEDRPEHRTAARSDLNMLVGLGGCERTAADYEALLSEAGLSLRRMLPAAAAFTVIEAAIGPPGATTPHTRQCRCCLQCGDSMQRRDGHASAPVGRVTAFERQLRGTELRCL